MGQPLGCSIQSTEPGRGKLSGLLSASPLLCHCASETEKPPSPAAVDPAARGRGVSKPQLLLYRASMVAISARVAVPWGLRVPSGVPVTMPWLTAHCMARSA